jgi:uncharacterized membrane protein
VHCKLAEQEKTRKAKERGVIMSSGAGPNGRNSPKAEDAMVSAEENHKAMCHICGREKPANELLSSDLLPAELVQDIRTDFPEWKETNLICSEDLKRYGLQHFRGHLEEAHGELTKPDQDFLESLSTHPLISRNVESEAEENYTTGQRIADKVAAFGGSWTFIIIFCSILIVWIAFNSVPLLQKIFDPYPYTLLNLVLSCVAALQAPLIMMSQNRQEVMDRKRSEHDYHVNLKAELEIQELHEKLDNYLLHQWGRLLKIQQTQIEMIRGLLKKADPEPPQKGWK